MAKYDDLLLLLDDTKIYSAGLIVRFARERGYAHSYEDLLRIRISINGRAMRLGFPRNGDGWVRLEGQGPTPGWYGWRWKRAALNS